MRSDLNKALGKDFPSIFGLDFYFECGDGWEPLIRKVSETIKKEQDEYKASKEYLESSLEERAFDDDSFGIVSQVKEKFGCLRVYVYRGNDAIYEAIQNIEDESSTVCEICGNHGELLYKNRWYTTRCVECR